jgi:hypothetical protein
VIRVRASVVIPEQISAHLDSSGLIMATSSGRKFIDETILMGLLQHQSHTNELGLDSAQKADVNLRSTECPPGPYFVGSTDILNTIGEIMASLR